MPLFAPALRQFWLKIAFICAIFSGTCPSLAASVRVITSGEMDFPEGQQSVQVELRASGYNVIVEQTDALEPGRLLDELESATQSGVVASVAVVRLGRGGIAYVWMPETKNMYRVTSSENDTARAANVLSLRVVELISLRGSGFDVERTSPDEPTEVIAEKKPSETPLDARPLPWMLMAAVGPQFGSGIKSPLSRMHLGLSRSAGEFIALEVTGHFSLGGASQRFDQGVVRVSEQGVSLGAFLQNSGRLRFQLGPAVGFRCVHLRSEPNDGSPAVSRDACGSTLGAAVRAGVEWERLSFWLSGLGSLATPRIDLLADGQVLATLGRPDGWLGVMIGWRF